TTGWSLPVLFFSESLHECNQGLSPFLFALLVFQSFSIDNKSLFHINKRLTKIKLHKFTFQLFMCMMCMLNYALQSILWWSLTGLLTGLIGAIALRVIQSKSKLKRYSICEQLLPNHSAIIGKNNRATSPLQQVIVGLKKYSIILIACFFLLFCNYFYTRPNFVGEATLNKIFPDDRFLLSFLLMTAPRRGDPDYLLRTIDSYLNNFPDKPDARSIYANDLKAKNYLRFYREKGSEINQRLHMSKAIKLVAENFKSTYIALVEDDFPLCDGKWKEVLTVIFNANLRVPKHCGIFVGTGGRKNKALVASNLLLKEESLEIPPDIILQNCLMGSGKGCEECTQTLVTSKVLLMYHIGYNTSTSPDRTYLKKDFQCGWRHPFNGDPSVEITTQDYTKDARPRKITQEMQNQ
ncbi:15918_t:CDS:2, partial [Gigaspora rosea]